MITQIFIGILEFIKHFYIYYLSLLKNYAQ